MMITVGSPVWYVVFAGWSPNMYCIPSSHAHRYRGAFLPSHANAYVKGEREKKRKKKKKIEDRSKERENRSKKKKKIKSKTPAGMEVALHFVALLIPPLLIVVPSFLTNALA